MPTEFNEAAAKHAFKLMLIRLAFVGAGFSVVMYCALLAGLYAFRGTMTNESMLAIAGLFGPMFGMVLQQQLSIMKDGSGFAFGDSQSSADAKNVTQTLASGVNRMAAEGVTRAKTAAVEAGVSPESPGTTTTTTTVETPRQPEPEQPKESKP